MDSKKVGKYVFWAGLILAFIIALLPEPEEWAIWMLVALGLVGGYMRISKASETHFIVLAIGLNAFTNVISILPTIGEYLGAILGALSFFMGAAVLALVIRNVIGWFR